MVYKWGVVVNVNGADGVMLDVEMADHKLSEAAEVPVEIVRLEPQRGYLELKVAFAEASSADGMSADAEAEDSELQPSGRSPAVGINRGEAGDRTPGSNDDEFANGG